MVSDGAGASFVVVANRLPVEAVTAEDGQSGWRVSPGGLVAALGPVMARNQGTWVGWTGQPDECGRALSTPRACAWCRWS